jgi:hypothetical protein
VKVGSQGNKLLYEMKHRTAAIVRNIEECAASIFSPVTLMMEAAVLL